MLTNVKEMYNRLQTQKEDIKTLVYIHFFYSFIIGVVEVFLNIMVYDITEDISFLVIYNLLRMTGGYFAIYSYIKITSKYKFDLRYTYFIFVSLLVLSFLSLTLFDFTKLSLIIFILLYGVAIGVFWAAQHNYVLSSIDFKERDFFASMLSMGKEIFTILVPVVAVASFYISDEILHINTYTSLIIFLSFISALMLLKIKKVRPLIIQEHSLIEIYDNLKKSKLQFPFYGYNLARGVLQTVKVILLTYFAVEALKTPLNIGIVELITGIFSIFIVSKLSHANYSSDRLKIMLISIYLTTAAYGILLATGLTPVGYIIFSLILIIANPMYGTTQNLIDLHTMDVVKLKDSYSFSIVYREMVLYVARVLGALISLFILYFDFNIMITSVLLTSLLIISMLLQHKYAKDIYNTLSLEEEK